LPISVLTATAGVADMSCGHQGPCDRRTPDRPVAVIRKRPEHRFGSDRLSKISEPLRHRARPRHPVRALGRNERGELGMFRVDEIPEDMHVAIVEHGGDFNAGNHAYAELASGPCGRRDRSNGVVIADGDRAETRLPREADHRGRVAAAVRRGRMDVEVDHLSRLSAARPDC
jgi:hypothetical protein